jgi:predicted small secreted protein
MNTMPRRSILAVALLVLSRSLSACESATGDHGDNIKRTGRLVLKGSEPFLQPVLIVSNSEHWALSGVDGKTAAIFQNKMVNVTGQRICTHANAALLPSIEVHHITRATP